MAEIRSATDNHQLRALLVVLNKRAAQRFIEQAAGKVFHARQIHLSCEISHKVVERIGASVVVHVTRRSLERFPCHWAAWRGVLSEKGGAKCLDVSVHSQSAGVCEALEWTLAALGAERRINDLATARATCGAQ